VIGAITRHLSIVAGLTGSLAAIVPGFLFWPRLSHGPFAGSLAPFYLLEMGLAGAMVLLTLLARTAIAAPAAWVACGLTGAFSLAAGLTIGGLYLPATVLFALSGVLADFAPVRPTASAGAAVRRSFKHLLLCGCAAVVQLAGMAGVASIGRSR
jgi:hypothetical protein